MRVIVLVVALLIGCGRDNAPEVVASSGPTSAEALSVCQRFVTERLKAPRTAQFSTAEEASLEQLAEDRWRARGFVDSENSFGALVRTDFDCIVTRGVDEQWRLIGLRAGDQRTGMFPEDTARRAPESTEAAARREEANRAVLEAAEAEAAAANAPQ